MIVDMRHAVGSRLRTLGLSGLFGTVAMVVVLGTALAGPLLASRSPTERVDMAFAPPSADAWLGTDYIGQDVLTRVLHGGLSILGLSAVAMVSAYLVGATVGLVAALARGRWDTALTRPLDLLLAIPPFLVLAVLATGAGSGPVVVVVAVALGNVPGIARVVRAAAWEVVVRGWVEAAYARGERHYAIAWREILPNIRRPLVSDIGVRGTAVIGLVGTANFLGFGLAPPQADWALMISENRNAMMLQPWSVLAPALCIALLAIGFNLAADALARVA